jgi:alanine racemase
VRAQQERFEGVVDQAERAGVRPRLRHLANSAATLTNPSAHYDLVRPGVAVYGLSPVPELGSPADFGLREAMRLVSRLSSVKDAPAGQGVSYGHTYTTSEQTRLGLVPMGYSDGVPRHASSVGPVQVGDDEVVLFGVGAAGEPTAQDWAAAVGTINYEIVTRVGARVPRVHTGGAQ